MKCCNPKTTVEAKVANGALIVSFPASTPPRIWRRNLGHAASLVTEIREDGGKNVLIMSDAANGTVETIGTFPDKDAALVAWKAVSSALLNGDVSVFTHPAQPSSCKVRSFLGRIIRLGLWLIALAVAVLVIAFMFMPLNPGMVSNDMPTKAPPAAVKTGVPVPADQLFGG